MPNRRAPAVPLPSFRIAPGRPVRLRKLDPDGAVGLPISKEAARDELERLTHRLTALQELLYAEHRHAVLVVLQGMDSAGKDGTIRKVFEGVNPQGVRVASFKVPTERERDHDFLWRVHAELPGRGEMVLFNRSHYEDVLAPRAHGTLARPAWERRYRSINAFERTIAEEGTTVLKFFLHISRDEQKRRLEARLEDRSKHWKFRVSDVAERRLWPRYRRAYEEAISTTSTPWAPWFVVPSNHKWLRDLVVSRTIVGALQALRMRYPPLPRAFRRLRIR